MGVLNEFGSRGMRNWIQLNGRKEERGTMKDVKDVKDGK